MELFSGFSKLSKDEKINLLISSRFNENDNNVKELLKNFWHTDKDEQKRFDEFSENTLTNFYFPYGVVPNLILDNKSYSVPMVIEESSVVAAASRSAKFWATRGGFHSEILGTEKVGQVHFLWKGNSEKLIQFFASVKTRMISKLAPLLESMVARGGGLKEIELVDKTVDEPHLYQLMATFETCDAMGANFINTILEAIGKDLKNEALKYSLFNNDEKEISVIMAILSNYTPNCRVKAYVECPIKDLYEEKIDISPEEFVEKFKMAIKISKIDVFRATTHNKGIFNGIDAVTLATGNDFRAIEACGHAYASRNGRYEGLSNLILEGDKFRFELEMPLAFGTIGGITTLHPLANFSLELLGKPDAQQLMRIAAAVGLAQNFGAVRSLVTTGIQKGHMKMHLLNILNSLCANDEERAKALVYFKDNLVSYKSVKDFLNSERQYH